MSELEARKYTSIRMLREEIRQDMQDYQLLSSDDNEGSRFFLLHGPLRWFSDYLKLQIDNNLSKLKELAEQENK